MLSNPFSVLSAYDMLTYCDICVFDSVIFGTLIHSPLDSGFAAVSS